MIRKIVFLSIFLSAISASATKMEPVDYVNPLVGTMSSYQLSTGNTYPAIALPWGMNFWTPQTGKMGDGWQYTYTANKIRGFKQTHQPSPWINDYGQFSIMPTVGEVVFDEEKRASWFSHQAETVKPYYYKVYLADYDTWVEIAPTERAAMMQFTFPETDKARVVIDAFDGGSSVAIDAKNRRVMGYTTKNSGGVPENFKNYFVIEFSHPIAFQACYSNDGSGLVENISAVFWDKHTGAIVGFPTLKHGEQVTLRIASSFISQEQAIRNLQELGDDSFETVKEKGRKRWNEVLGRIEIDDDNTDHLRTFYSCLYRATLFPRMFYEHDATGKVVHYSPYNGQICDGYMFTDTGFWDTFRSLFPLVNLLYPSMGEKMLEGLANAYLESGFLPEWASPGHRNCMVGNNSAAVVADGLLNCQLSTLNSQLKETLWQAVVHGANAVHPDVASTGRLGYDYYNRLGYVPCDVKIKESAARTLEYAYNDWCIYQIGKLLGKPSKEIDIYAKRAKNYRNLFNPKYNLMQGRHENGDFSEPFSPFKWGGDFTEGNSWHYTWSVFHDPAGLIGLMGGSETFAQMLDSVFIVPPIFDDSYYGHVIHEIREMQIAGMGNYAHGNQPVQHMIYLYNYAAQPWKAQYWVRQTMDRLYAATPDGYCGDEDNGQTSAWYVFSALGFYPVCPASGQYAIGSPYFKKAKIKFENGHSVTLTADDDMENRPYIEKMTIDGRDYQRNYLTIKELLKSSNIHFEMSEKPNKQRGTASESLPYSFSNERRK